MSAVESPPYEVRTLRPVFLLAATIVAAFAILVTAFPIPSGVLLLEAQTWASRNVGWYYLLAMTVYLVFVVGVALSGVVAPATESAAHAEVGYSDGRREPAVKPVPRKRPSASVRPMRRTARSSSKP